MTTDVWTLVDPGADGSDPPGAAGLLVAAVRAGVAGPMFPPVVTDGPDRTVAFQHWLSGESDARALAHSLHTRRFAPLCVALDHLAAWCTVAASTYAPDVPADLLTVTNADLFAPFVREAFVVCAANRPSVAEFVGLRRAQTETLLDRFLDRLCRDLPAWPDRPELRWPVTGLWMHGEETHNGGQRVIRVDLAGGGSVAYKPRPASGELLFLGDDPRTSVFALLNGLPSASGEVRLPVLPSWRGEGADRGDYSWQEWVERPRQWGVLRREGPYELAGTRLEPVEAARFWRRAGALAAACFAFGITDLHGGNLLAGARPGGDPMLYPVDLEMFFTQAPRLSHTTLVYAPSASTTHHVGLENEPRWCDIDGHPVCWTRGPDGALSLRVRDESITRTTTRSVVGDTAGNAGYGGYLPAMLRGMFDCWTLMCRHRTAIHDLVAEAGDAVVRVVRRSTAEYVRALQAEWVSGEPAAADFDAAERQQLDQGDVPYFFRAVHGGPLRHLTGELTDDVELTAATGRLDLATLGTALRDAIEHVFDDIPSLHVDDPDLGLRLRLYGPADGSATFDWPRAGRRITYRWSGAAMRLAIDAIDTPLVEEPVPAVAEIRQRLLRLDRLDGRLRMPWARGGFADESLHRRLTTLTRSAAGWLRDVLDEHGWPGRSTVGTAATLAASRLVQHLEDDLPLQRRCLELMTAAAEAGDFPLRELAYVTDTIRLAEGRPQLYGTKFDRVDGEFVPCRIEDPDHVEERRRAMGLLSLEDYAEQLRQRFAS
ncbi:DUF4135 domain-containing protein [Fodinicola acaciae]|uniref:DUF4135 domain-containing protein n=1 Tax=Fodinicola acaciae TaxID=2681555 RepID=UPI0013D7C429|nr:DUF4135 domain-containing protein [Fodinicola acaciae]